MKKITSLDLFHLLKLPNFSSLVSSTLNLQLQSKENTLAAKTEFCYQKKYFYSSHFPFSSSSFLSCRLLFFSLFCFLFSFFLVLTRNRYYSNNFKTLNYIFTPETRFTSQTVKSDFVQVACACPLHSTTFR